MEGKLPSMEDARRWSLVCAVAPVVWGSTYYVTHEFLPADRPLWGATLRALPAGLLLLALRRRRPRGHWWWRSMVLGLLNVGAFFVLIYVAAQALPVSVSMATSPLTMMVVVVDGRQPAAVPDGCRRGHRRCLADARPGGRAAGRLASVTAMLFSSLGYVLAKRWRGEVAWRRPRGNSWRVVCSWSRWRWLSRARRRPWTPAVLGFVYVSGVATALAFVAWFAGLAHLRTSTVALIGLLNPVTGVLLGTLVAGEGFTPWQLGGLLLVLAGVAAGQVARPMLTRAGTGPSPQPPVSAPPSSEHRSEVRARSAREGGQAVVRGAFMTDIDTAGTGRVVEQRGLWFDEFEEGTRYLHRPGRTVTETDNVLFSTLTMNTQALHLDAAWLRLSPSAAADELDVQARHGWWGCRSPSSPRARSWPTSASLRPTSRTRSTTATRSTARPS